MPSSTDLVSVVFGYLGGVSVESGLGLDGTKAFCLASPVFADGE